MSFLMVKNAHYYSNRSLLVFVKYLNQRKMETIYRYKANDDEELHKNYLRIYNTNRFYILRR